MFVRHQMVLPVGFPAARARLLRFVHDGWLTEASGEAYAAGMTGLTRVGPFGAVMGASKLVRVRVLDPVPREDVVALPLRWEATGAMGRLFPILDADLMLTAAGGETTELALTGAYRPPLDGLGHGLDQLVLHRVATATIRSLLQRIAGWVSGAPCSHATGGTADAR